MEQESASIGAFRREIRSRIERTRARIDILSADAISSRTRATLLPAIEACDRIFIALIAFEHAVLSGETSHSARRTVRVVTTTLHRMAREAPRPEPRPERLHRQQRVLARIAEQDSDLFGKGAHVCAQAVQELITAWQTLSTPSTQPARPDKIRHTPPCCRPPRAGITTRRPTMRFRAGGLCHFSQTGPALRLLGNDGRSGCHAAQRDNNSPPHH
ncbi:membrane protein [Acetobacter malorum]|uniref:Membrane protein n=1 Tax=Acetobacter malorum TaxID=178901 RepID=A0A177GAV0_9PROT|nr:hypothetical protein [Acetobacter malorum]OAG77408.1 membrane protein [Acetobacter malorum]